MAHITAMFILLCATLVAPLSALPRPSEVITQPKPGDEYVFVQSTGSGARPIARKDKSQENQPFETSHKVPLTVTYTLNHDDHEENDSKGKQKRAADPAESPAPAPAGAIKLDVQQLLAKYKTELKTTSTTTKAPRSSSRTTKSSRRGQNKRTKKEAKEVKAEVTTTKTVLTTAAPAPKKLEEDDVDDVPLVASGSEKQRSRIQIKKGPNGQEYEYEYVYYYYDDEDDAKDKPKDKPKETKEKVSNSHDGPARNQITQAPKHAEKASATAEANEVLPSTRGRSRGRQLDNGETVGEERLPANTRFPPRSRNLNTTPIPEEDPKTTRPRIRRPTTEAAPTAAATVSETDSVSDETQGSRGRTRANIKRPSLELVDNASFNTHSNTAGAEPSPIGPSFPADLPAGPEQRKTTNEAPETVPTEKEEGATNTPAEEVTTMMSAMDKVALDLYAILQGTQKLSGEETETNSTEESSTETEVTTAEATTDVAETTTTSTTTTTTTTTTEAPTTTTTTEAAFGRGRYKGRGSARKTTHATTESAHSETKPKNKFNRPSFGNRPRPGARTTTEGSVDGEVAAKEEVKPVSHSRPTLSRSRFGASRTRARTTAAPDASEDSSDASSGASSTARPALTRPRSSFNLRARGRTTAAPDSDSSPADSEAAPSSPEASSTTARTRRIGTSGGVRPLRPGPRINIGARGRLGTSTTSTTESPAEDHVTGDEEQTSQASEEKEQETSSAPADTSPLGRLRSKHRPAVQVKPKAAASAPVQVRRVNPLIARRRPGQTSAEPSSTEVSSEATTESAAPSSAEESSSDETDEPTPSSTSTTEEPRGLNKLLAGRRRLAKPGAHH